MQAFYFGQDSRRLFGALHDPGGRPRTGIIFCPPYGWEMVNAYAHFARWSKELAKSGYAVFRYHPFGMGESDGSSRDFTLDSAVADAVAAIHCFRERARPERLVLFGLRFGAFVAVQAALVTQPDFLLLWSPVTNLRQYFRELLRLRLTAELVHRHADRVPVTTREMIDQLEAGHPVEILGRELSPDLYRQMNAPPCWPDTPPAPQMLWLARPQEREQGMFVLDGWNRQAQGLHVKFSPGPPFWEGWNSEFPREQAALSAEWLSNGTPLRGGRR